MEKNALAFDLHLVLQLLLALLRVVVQQGGEPESLSTGVAGEAGVAHHVHLQLVARLKCFWARVALELAFLLFDLFQLWREILDSSANLSGHSRTPDNFAKFKSGVCVFGEFVARQTFGRKFDLLSFLALFN